MGSVPAVVEISSDDEEDGWRAPRAGKSNSTVVAKDKSSDDGLVWAEKLLDEDFYYADAIGDALHDSAEMQVFLASLIDEPGVVADPPNKTLVHEPEKKRPRDDDDDDDDDCVILDGDPEKAVAVAKEEKTPRDDATEDELEIVAEKGEVACRDFPHPRHLCAKLPFTTSSHASHCRMCHCYVCDSPAPCAFWGKGTRINDHCHATDKDLKWKKLRQYSKSKGQQTPKLCGVQNLLLSSPTISTNLMVPSTERLPISSTESQIQQMHPSIVISQNMGQGITRPTVPPPMSKTTILSNKSKRARVVPPPVHVPPNVNSMKPSLPSYGPMQPAFPRGFQKAQVAPGSQRAQIAPGFQTAQAPGFQRAQVALESQRAQVALGFQRAQVAPGSQRAQVAPGSQRAQAPGFQRAQVALESQRAQVAPGFQQAQVAPGFQTAQVPRPFSATKGSQGYQRQAIPNPPRPANTLVRTGVPLSRCTSLSSQGKQQPQGPSTDATGTLRDVLSFLAHELDVPDYNVVPPLGQSASTQTVYPNQLLAQEKARQGRKINTSNVAGRPSQIRLSDMPNLLNHASGSTVIPSDAVQASQPLCQLNSESSLDPNEMSLSTVVLSLPWNTDGA